MPSLKEVKNRITSVTSTQQITKAMKMVAAAKLRRAQDKIVQFRPYSENLNTVLQTVSSTLTADDELSVYNQVRDVKSVLIVAITSDRGLCGGFNTNVNKAVISMLGEKYADKNVEILSVGNKARDFFSKRGYNMVADYTGIYSNLTFDAVREAAEYAMQGFADGKYDAVELVYNEFKNVAVQIIRKEPFLPLVQMPKVEGNTDAQLDFIFEPNKEKIVAELIPKSLKTAFYKAVLESNAAEHGARMTAMDKATENAGELLKELKLQYNRSRQASITKEILEIVGGAEALNA